MIDNETNTRLSRFFEEETILGVQVIAGNSRVERNHGIDHLVKELRLAVISTICEANMFLEKTNLPKMNRKFSRPAARP
jgi:hypothetical protein